MKSAGAGLKKSLADSSEHGVLSGRSEAHLRGFGIIDSLWKRTRDYGKVFYTVKTTFSIKNKS
ncbi:MAG: hypothetical protein KKB22_03710 [Candidatus Omnitrophica bacterium]|nr:hypothetical protein [Candidatus Omnitrophota bacterium]